MIAFIIYLIATTLVGFALALCIISSDSSIDSMAYFFNPIMLRREFGSSAYGITLILFLSYSLMLSWGIFYWIVEAFKLIIRRLK